jgi:gamma-glutamylcyclotransferase (GGCT)/AIG2-like uncharacterized protein YtfP
MVRFLFYGTLKRGGRLHAWVEDLDGTYVTDAVVAGFSLYNLSWFPGIVPDKQGHVSGEIFEFANDAKVLTTFDNVEAVEAGLFRRELLPETEVPTWIYIFDQDLPEKAEKIPSGVWKI